MLQLVNEIRTKIETAIFHYLIRRAAKSHGFIDPFSILAKLRQFSEPSDVQEPIELIRAGAVFHARGLVNTKAIQHNLDWVWPHWVERQFNPRDPGFIPRAFSFSHINLTQRNWTALGLPDYGNYPIVDPRGLISPGGDSWSLDFWLIGPGGEELFPSRQEQAVQRNVPGKDLAVFTEVENRAGKLSSTAGVKRDEAGVFLEISVCAEAPEGTRLVASARPCNPEGVQFIDAIGMDGVELTVSAIREDSVVFSDEPDSRYFSSYAQGDVRFRLDEKTDLDGVSCPVGMATAALAFNIGTAAERKLRLRIPLPAEQDAVDTVNLPWKKALDNGPELRVPDKNIEKLFADAVRTLILLSSEDVVPGPCIYKRFWFRDACLMLNAIVSLGMEERAEKHLSGFRDRQSFDGYFHSQEGEWDSNGQVLWIIDRYQRLSGKSLPDDWLDMIEKGGDWIIRKRARGWRPENAEGLLPAGFSAEHLGPVDFYFWDDFWALAGLRCAAAQLSGAGRNQAAERILSDAAAFEKSIRDSVSAASARNPQGAIPAAPSRRMDSGAVGSMVADYPLQITRPDDSGVESTLEYLLENCFVHGGFFQDMIHSGINAYLTLALAQTLLRKGDPRSRDLILSVAELASSTGNWPEAVHPFTLGGCMGDGQHGWAAAEWAMMMRNIFIREEKEKLVLCGGLFPEWYRDGGEMSFGPVPTPWGEVSVSARALPEGLRVFAEGELREIPETILLSAPDCIEKEIKGLNSETVLDWSSK